jgi:hypothetical protein
VFDISGQYTDVNTDFQKALTFIKEKYATELEGYNGDNVNYILDKLKSKYSSNTTSTNDESGRSSRRRRHVAVPHFMDIAALIGDNPLINMHDSSSDARDRSAVNPQESRDSILHSAGRILDKYLLYKVPSYSSPRKSETDTDKQSWIRDLKRSDRSRTGSHDDMQKSMQILGGLVHARSKRGVEDSDAVPDDADTNDASNMPLLTEQYSNNSKNNSYYEKKYKKYSLSDTLLKLAHIMHYISIAILGVFVIQVGQNYECL